MTDENLMGWNDELSDRETFFIGKIVAQWGAMEHEIFNQTLLSFDIQDGTKEIVLPAKMNNVQFTGVLDLWKERVAGTAFEARKKKLERQYERIVHLKVFRDALVHGMLQWTAEDLAEITSERIKKKEIIRVKFTTDDLGNFYRQVASINYEIRMNLDDEDGTAERFGASSGYISRRFLAQISGHPAADDWLPSQTVQKLSSKD